MAQRSTTPRRGALPDVSLLTTILHERTQRLLAAAVALASTLEEVVVDFYIADSSQQRTCPHQATSSDLRVAAARTAPRGSSVMSKGGRGGRSSYTRRLGSSSGGGGRSIGMLSHDAPVARGSIASPLLQCRIAHRRDQSISANTTEALTSRAVKPCTSSPSYSSFMRALVVATVRCVCIEQHSVMIVGPTQPIGGARF